MHLFRIVVLLGLTLSVLTGCVFKSDFEKFAYEACVKEGKYPNSVCTCNAKNLDSVLSSDEKSMYKQTLINPMAALSMLGKLDKLMSSITKCLS